jgi:Flp pilus assembly protein TadD
MLESALQDCRAALKLAPGDAAYLDSLGMVLLKMGRLDEALIAYNEAVEKRARATSYMGRAFVYQQRGDEAQARSDTAEAVKLDARILTTFDGYGLTRPGQTQTASQ